jgi:hypothetical protein
MFWLLLLSGIVWFFLIEFVRGRPGTSGVASFWLKFAAPLGAIAFVVAAALVVLCRAPH